MEIIIIKVNNKKDKNISNFLYEGFYEKYSLYVRFFVISLSH